MNGTVNSAEKRIDTLTSAVASVAKSHPAFYVGEAGSASTDKALTKLFTQQLSQAGVRSVPLTVVILVLVFGSLLAAWVPLMLGLRRGRDDGLTNIISHVTPMDPGAQLVVLLIGLAVGVAYTLFYLRREREERAAGRSERAALEAAAATSGRSVLVSGLTVMIAMAGMLFAGGQTFISFSIATMIVVAVAMIGSLIFLPALLSWLGHRVEKGRIPLLGRSRRPVGEGRVWSKVLTPVLKHPVVSVIAAGALLLAIAIPTLSLHTAQDGPKAFPAGAPTIQTLDRLQAAFPGQASPAIVAARTDTTALAFRAAVKGLGTALVSTHRGYGAISTDTNPAHTAARIQIPLPGSGTDTTSTNVLLTLRGQLLPQTLGKVPGAVYAVTGQTASSYDGSQNMKSSLPIVFAFVLTIAFLLLLASFRPLVIALKSVALNLLSVAAASASSWPCSSTAGASTCSASNQTARSPHGCR